jgi:hypothetical protein
MQSSLKRLMLCFPALNMALHSAALFLARPWDQRKVIAVD